jgi:hypothetical protein
MKRGLDHPQSPPQQHHPLRERLVVDEFVGPDRVQQLLPANDAGCSAHQLDEQLERLRGERHHGAFPE